jgi:hypothetical protein
MVNWVMMPEPLKEHLKRVQYVIVRAFRAVADVNIDVLVVVVVVVVVASSSSSSSDGDSGSSNIIGREIEERDNGDFNRNMEEVD